MKPLLRGRRLSRLAAPSLECAATPQRPCTLWDFKRRFGGELGAVARQHRTAGSGFVPEFEQLSRDSWRSRGAGGVEIEPDSRPRGPDQRNHAGRRWIGSQVQHPGGGESGTTSGSTDAAAKLNELLGATAEDFKLQEPRSGQVTNKHRGAPMAGHYSPKHFLRQVPKPLLKTDANAGLCCIESPRLR